LKFRERHDTRTNGQHYTASDRRTGTSPDTRDILVASSRGCRACRACRRGCHEDATRKLLPWNFSFTTLRCSVLSHQNHSYIQAGFQCVDGLRIGNSFRLGFRVSMPSSCDCRGSISVAPSARILLAPYTAHSSSIPSCMNIARGQIQTGSKTLS